jgi:hypothetical protein
MIYQIDEPALVNPATTDWQKMLDKVSALGVALNSVIYDVANNNQIRIKAGSVFEVMGAYFKLDTDVVLSIGLTNGSACVCADTAGALSIQTARPYFDTVKGAFYIGNLRVLLIVLLIQNVIIDVVKLTDIMLDKNIQSELIINNTTNAMYVRTSLFGFVTLTIQGAQGAITTINAFLHGPVVIILAYNTAGIMGPPGDGLAASGVIYKNGILLLASGKSNSANGNGGGYPGNDISFPGFGKPLSSDNNAPWSINPPLVPEFCFTSPSVTTAGNPDPYGKCQIEAWV